MAKCLVNQYKYNTDKTVRHYQLKHSRCNEILWRLLIGCCPYNCLPSFLFVVICLISSLPLISMDVSPPILCFLFVLHLILYPHIHLFCLSFFLLLFLLLPCSLVCLLPPAPVSRCSQYGIHNEGLCYVRSHWSRDVEILYDSSKGAIMDKSCSHLWYKVACRTCTNVWLPTSQ